MVPGTKSILVPGTFCVLPFEFFFVDWTLFFFYNLPVSIHPGTTNPIHRMSVTAKSAKKTVALFWPYVSSKVAPAIEKVLKTRWIGQGPYVGRAEEMFNLMFKTPHAVAVNSCTSALHLALILSHVKEGDEVITTPLTCYATITPILYERARPVFADIHPSTLNMDPRTIEKKITKKTKAILPVHWGGEPCDMDAITAIARRRGIPVIEDAAHALGATYRGQPVGALSDFTCFSFQAIKQITTGDGGMLAALDAKNAERARLLRWYAIDRNFQGDIYQKFQVTDLGYKYNMTDLDSVMLMAQLEDFAFIHETRRRIADFYRQNLEGAEGVTLLEQAPDRQSAHWLFTMLVERRPDFQKKMAAAGIETSLVHIRCDVYPILGGRRQDLPGMNEVEPKYIALPLHCNLTEDDLESIVRTIREGW